MLLVQSKIMTTRVNGLTINDTEKAIAIHINKTPNNTKHHIVKSDFWQLQPWCATYEMRSKLFKRLVNLRRTDSLLSLRALEEYPEYLEDQLG